MKELTRGDLLPRTQSTSTEPTHDARCGNRPTCQKEYASRVPKGAASVGFRGAELEKCSFALKKRTFRARGQTPQASHSLAVDWCDLPQCLVSNWCDLPQ